MTRVVIIDDEINSRELLHNMLTNYCDHVEVLGMAHDVSSGIQLIRQKEPQLVFLDIEMPGGSGFDILKVFDKINFKVIFVTGYDQYAIKAIKYSALDYILKPVDLNELKLAVEKAKSVIFDQNDQIGLLQSIYFKPSEQQLKIVIPSHNNHSIINVNDILYLKAMDGYSVVLVEPKSKHISAQPLNYYEELLPASQFFRIHKSYLINCKKVTGYDTGRGGNVTLINDINLPISVRRKSLFIAFMNRLNS